MLRKRGKKPKRLIVNRKQRSGGKAGSLSKKRERKVMQKLLRKIRTCP